VSNRVEIEVLSANKLPFVLRAYHLVVAKKVDGCLERLGRTEHKEKKQKDNATDVVSVGIQEGTS